MQETPTTTMPEQFMNQLLTFSGGDQPIHIDASVIRSLKDEVARLIRADIQQAVKLAELTQSLAAACEDAQGTGLAHHASALALYASGRYADALAHYEQAQAIYNQLGQEVDAARIGRAMVDVLILLSDYERALTVAAQARAVFERYDEPILLAQLETNVGNIYHRLDRYQEALAFYERAGTIFAAHQHEQGLAFVYYNCANQYTGLDDFAQALALYQQAGQVFARLDMPVAINDVEYSMAWLYFRRSKFQDSLRLFAQVRGRAQALGDTTLDALCDLDLSEVYLRLNAANDAMESARSAAEKFQALGMRYEQTKARMCLGMAHTQMNDLPAAERELQEARRGFLAEGNTVFTALTNLYLSEILMRQRKWPQATELCVEANHLFTQHGLATSAAHAQLQLARLKLSSGQVEESGRLCEAAMNAIDDIEAPWLKQQGFHLLGKIMEQSGDVAAAYGYYQQSVEHLEGLRNSIRVDEYKCAFLRDKLGIYEDLVQLCLRAGSTEKVEEAWSYAEAAKSRALVDLLAANREIQGKTPDVADSSMQQQWHDLREQLDWFYNRISEVEWRNPGRPDRSVHQWRKEVRQREHALMKLMQQMRIEDAEYASLRTVSRMDMAELRACLADDEILVEYFVVNDRIKVFVIDADGLRGCYDVTTLGAIAPVLRRFQFNLKKVALRASSRRDDTSQAVTSDHGQDDHATFSQAHADQSLQLLYTRLIEPIRSLLEGKNLHIVPHGLLHYIPFHALYDGREYMIDRHEISYAPSAGVLKLCVDKANQLRKAEGRRQKAEGGSQEITSSLNNPQSAIRHPQSGGALIMGIPDQMMPSIANEVGMVASLWPGARVYVGADATISRLKQIAPECRLLHVASHGVFRHDNPMFSALKLSDSWLNFYDIFNLALNAELVTLSACETGINEVFPGDELFGLMRGFLYAGAPSLMVSLWAVHDNSTAQFMQLFYTALNEGQSKRAAIRHAYLGVKQNNSHPCYWAPFILMGAP